MSLTLNKIVFTGETLDGHDIEHVRKVAEKRLGMSPSELDLVFSGRRIVLKRGLSEGEAERYIRELNKLGMHVVSKPQAALPANSLKAQMIAQHAQGSLAVKRSGLFGLFSRGESQ